MSATKEDKKLAKIEAQIERNLGKAGFRRPVITDFEGEREEFFRQLKKYNDKVGFMMSEVMNKRIKL